MESTGLHRETQGERQIRERKEDRRSGLTSEESHVKEMTTKLAWAVGSTLHVGYSRRSALRNVLHSMAQQMYNRRLDWMDSAR